MPKVYTRKPIGQQQNRSASKLAQTAEQQFDQQVYVNTKHVAENGKTLQQIRILTSLMAGLLAGILDITQLVGPLLFVGVHLIITIIIVVGLNPIEGYFMKKSHIFSGVGSGILIFVCAWMIVHNIVYTL